jgi:hypothetical protein
MKPTLKVAKKVFQATKIAALAFENGSRSEAYTGIDIITAIKFVARHNAAGRMTLLLPYSADVIVMRWEIANKCRIPFTEAAKLAINAEQLISAAAPVTA